MPQPPEPQASSRVADGGQFTLSSQIVPLPAPNSGPPRGAALPLPPPGTSPGTSPSRIVFAIACRSSYEASPSSHSGS